MNSRTLAKLLIAIGLVIMIAAAIAEFILARDVFLASEILGLALSQIGIVLWATRSKGRTRGFAPTIPRHDVI